MTSRDDRPRRRNVPMESPEQEGMDLVVGPQEQDEAGRVAATLDALRTGRGGLDKVPIVDDADPLPELVAMAYLLEALGPRGELQPARSEEIWRSIAGAPAVQTQHIRKRLRWFGAIAWGLSAVCAVLLVFQLGGPGPGVDSGVLMTTPSAVAAVDADLARYASGLMAHHDSPRGDTSMRALRAARFDAWRRDASRQYRRGLGRGLGGGR